MKIKDRHAIRSQRKLRGYSQKDLAYLCGGRSQNAVSLIENGGLTTITDDFAVAIARRLGLAMEDVFEVRGVTIATENAIDMPAGCERRAAS